MCWSVVLEIWFSASILAPLWYTFGCWAVFCMLYLRSDFLPWFQLLYGMLLNIEQYYYAGCRASCFIWCKWILEDKLTPGPGVHLDRRNASVSCENRVNHFQTVFPASDSEPKRFTRFYLRMWNGWKLVSHWFSSHCFLLFLVFFLLNSCLVQQVKMLCI